MWRKKIERDVSQGVPLDMFSVKAEKKRQRERMVCYDFLRGFCGSHFFYKPPIHFTYVRHRSKGASRDDMRST